MSRLALGVKRAAELADRVRAPAPGVVVLIYHRVGGASASQVDLPLDVFRAQMSWLREHAHVLTLDAAAARLGAGVALDVADAADRAEPAPAIRPAVVITFDDGTADFADAAAVLVEFDLPATLYVATQFIDEQREFPWGAPPISWATLRDVHTTGRVTVGSHTHRHALFDRVEPAAAAADLDRSCELIADHLGAPPLHFAYPKAVLPSAEVDEVVRARFRTAALAGTRPNAVGRTDLHALSRSPVQRADGMRFFRAKVHGGLRLEDEMRRVANRIRYAGASV